MTNPLKSFIQFLDEFYKLFKTFPPEFKIWVYILIVLVFLTISASAIFYLRHKEKLTLQYFSLEQPRNNQEIPMGQRQNWLVQGHFPLVEDLTMARSASVEIEVYKLPEYHLVQQTGKSRVSTVEGVWTFEFAKFAGDGSYEIVANGYLAGLTVFRKIKVHCKDKTQAIKNIIAKDRKIRGLDKLEIKTEDEINLDLVSRQLHAKEQEFFTVFPNDLTASERVVNEALQTVDEALVVFPHDAYLQNLRAYFFKNYAMVMRNLGRMDEFERGLEEAATMFATILEQKPNDAVAWNGLGSIAILRNDPRRGLYYINRALELIPNYQAAIHDRQIALEMLERHREKGSGSAN